MADHRGRDNIISSGRGGAGNIRQSSLSRDARPTPHSGPEDYSDTRGRELGNTSISPTRRGLSSSGRGGAGNIRSASKDATTIRAEISREREVINAHREHEGPLTSGRGGYGNIEKPRSRSRSQQRTSLDTTATGRGGYGNIVEGHVGHDLERLDEEERRLHHLRHSEEEVHSSGRGGQGNIIGGGVPGPEHHGHEHRHEGYTGTGRGGAGNIRGEIVEQRSE